MAHPRGSQRHFRTTRAANPCISASTIPRDQLTGLLRLLRPHHVGEALWSASSRHFDTRVLLSLIGRSISLPLLFAIPGFRQPEFLAWRNPGRTVQERRAAA